MRLWNRRTVRRFRRIRRRRWWSWGATGARLIRASCATAAAPASGASATSASSATTSTFAAAARPAHSTPSTGSSAPANPSWVVPPTVLRIDPSSKHEPFSSLRQTAQPRGLIVSAALKPNEEAAAAAAVVGVAAAGGETPVKKPKEKSRILNRENLAAGKVFSRFISAITEVTSTWERPIDKDTSPTHPLQNKTTIITIKTVRLPQISPFFFIDLHEVSFIFLCCCWIFFLIHISGRPRPHSSTFEAASASSLVRDGLQSLIFDSIEKFSLIPKKATQKSESSIGRRVYLLGVRVARQPGVAVVGQTLLVFGQVPVEGLEKNNMDVHIRNVRELVGNMVHVEFTIFLNPLLQEWASLSQQGLLGPLTYIPVVDQLVHQRDEGERDAYESTSGDQTGQCLEPHCQLEGICRFSEISFLPVITCNISSNGYNIQFYINFNMTLIGDEMLRWWLLVLRNKCENSSVNSSWKWNFIHFHL